MWKFSVKMGSNTMLLRPAFMSLVCVASDPAPLAAETAVMSVGGKVRAQDNHSSM